MARIAIIGGGISGLTAAYELELARKRGADVDWHLYEATDRLGGIMETTRIATPEGEYILEGGPDGWVSEKPWARELAIELGLESELIYSNDATRKTWIYLDGKLQAIPDGMRMMVPEDLRALEDSPLLSPSARQAYADEPARAEELKRSAPQVDESVASFVQRHFGEEVLRKLAAPLLSGVFGGDVHKLSVRAVMPQFVSMEQEHGSLILALKAAKIARGNKPRQPIFTSLRRGMASLIEALVSFLPSERLHLNADVHELAWDEDEWSLWTAHSQNKRSAVLPAAGSLSAPPAVRTTPSEAFEKILVATSLNVTRRLLQLLDPVETALLPSSGSALSLLPTNASSAVLVAFAWNAELARGFTIPPGFGFLVPGTAPGAPCSPTVSSSAKVGRHKPQLLAATFVDQKFPNRVPPGVRIIRAFFSSDSAERFSNFPDEEVASAALHQLESILGPMPRPMHSEVSRWPRSLPQYEVGHLDRMAKLDFQLSRVPGLHLLGNSYRGVGISDLIRDARSAARAVVSGL